MKDLFVSELRRFYRPAFAVAFAHLLVLLFVNRMSDFFQQSYYESVVPFGIYMLLGVALAVVQVGSYRKPSQWLWLIHRPLRSGQIFGALALSAFLLLVLAMFLPLLLLVIGTDVFTTKVVDARHYMMLAHMLAFSMMAWLAGAHACVSRHKAAIAVLAVPVLLAMHLVSVWWLLLPVAIGLAWLGWITRKGFRANREAPVPGNVTLLMTALPLQLGLYLLVFELGQFLFVTGSILLGSDPLNTEFPPKGGLIEVERALPQEELVLGLAGSEDARAASWREQLPLMEPVRVGAFLQRFPLRHQLGNLQVPTQWYDEKHDTLWTFSHDDMLFHGRDPQSGADRGRFGVGGVNDTTPFTEIPLADQEGHLLTRAALFAIDEDEQRLHELFRLPDGEWFTDVPRAAFNRLLVLTNQRLLAYRADRQSAFAFAPPLLDWALPLPRGVEHLETATVAELMDGWLVSFLYGDGHRQIGFSQFSVVVDPWQQVVFVHDDGNAVVVNERELQRDYPALYQVGWWFSPLLHTLSEWPDTALDKGLTWPLRLDVLPDARVFYPVAILLMLLSLALGAWWLRGAATSRSRRTVWLASCALLGLPAFLSLLCLEPRAVRDGCGQSA